MQKLTIINGQIIKIEVSKPLINKAKPNFEAKTIKPIKKPFKKVKK